MKKVGQHTKAALVRISFHHLDAACVFLDGTGNLSQNKTILVCSEQGVGDELYFSAYLPKLIEISGKVILETDPRLTHLFKESLGEISVFPYSRRIEYEQPVFNYGWLPKSIYPDFYIDLASLPHFLTEEG